MLHYDKTVMQYKCMCNFFYLNSTMFGVSAMNVLDGDDVRLSAHGRLAERDIVQVSGA